MGNWFISVVLPPQPNYPTITTQPSYHHSPNHPTTTAQPSYHHSPTILPVPPQPNHLLGLKKVSKQLVFICTQSRQSRFRSVTLSGRGNLQEFNHTARSHSVLASSTHLHTCCPNTTHSARLCTGRKPQARDFFSSTYCFLLSPGTLSGPPGSHCLCHAVCIWLQTAQAASRHENCTSGAHCSGFTTPMTSATWCLFMQHTSTKKRPGCKFYSHKNTSNIQVSFPACQQPTQSGEVTEKKKRKKKKN